MFEAECEGLRGERVRAQTKATKVREKFFVSFVGGDGEAREREREAKGSERERARASERERPSPRKAIEAKKKLSLARKLFSTRLQVPDEEKDSCSRRDEEELELEAADQGEEGARKSSGHRFIARSLARERE